MKEYLKVANDPILWLMAMPVVIVALWQALSFSKKAANAAESIGMTKEESKYAFKIGATSAIGPAVAIIAVMLSLMAVIGGPMAWLRLSVIGSAPAELSASMMGAKAMGVEFGGEGYGVMEYANSVWAMTLNGMGWLLFTALFTDKLETIRHKATGGDEHLTAEISGAAMVGAMAYLAGNQVVGGMEQLIPAVVAGASMILLGKLAKKHPKLLEFNLGIAMVIGMVAGIVFRRLG